MKLNVMQNISLLGFTVTYVLAISSNLVKSSAANLGTPKSVLKKRKEKKIVYKQKDV